MATYTLLEWLNLKKDGKNIKVKETLADYDLERIASDDYIEQLEKAEALERETNGE